MSRDLDNSSRWVATRKVDGDIEYLVSHTGWNPDARFAKVFDTKSEARAFLKEAGAKGTIRKYK
tara:strand:+ start:130 stop:321 length:192 start_codon:yes stop_codon:yes gene_type:complete